MLSLDASELYDLSEAGRRLLSDPARLARLARQGRVPATWTDEGLRLPRAWVDAASGETAADAEGLKRYWLERLAPPSPDARRATKDRDALPLRTLEEPDAVARRLWMDAARLARLDREGTLPGLRVDGGTHYDAELVAHLEGAFESGGAADARGDAARRRAEIAALGRFEYATGLDRGAEPPPTATRPAAPDALSAAPRAWRLPDDLTPTRDDDDTGEGTGGSRLIEADGFETIDEDP